MTCDNICRPRNMALACKLTSKIYEIQAHTSKVTCLDIGETGRVLVTGGQDKNINLWAFGNEKCFMSLNGHNSNIDCVKFAYNDDIVYSSDDSGIIRRWDLNSPTECSTFFGHMKSVRTLDFHPYGEYVASGSNDTSVRLWDVRNNTCIKKYKGHIANVNSVKFSPDGSWIASAGTEGSVIIWDIRMSKQIIEFVEHASPVTCIQFHPFELLLATGRNDGSIDLYDLENKLLISRFDRGNAFTGHTIKCVTFSENGECLFVGTAEGISVLGWEPDREFDHIESTWSILGDMKIVNNKLICGTFENSYIAIHALGIDQIIPFYNPTNTPFNPTQSSRKSFSRGNGKLRLSIGNNTNGKENDNSQKRPINEGGGLSSPNLSFEMIEEEDLSTRLALSKPFDAYSYSVKTDKIDYASLPSVSHDKSFQLNRFISDDMHYVPNENELYKFGKHIESYESELDYYPVKNSTVFNNINEPEREDFPVNNAQPPDYAPKLSTTTIVQNTNSKHSSITRIKNSTSSTVTTSSSASSISGSATHDSNRRLNHAKDHHSALPRKIVNSMSVTDLHKIDDHTLNNHYGSKRQSTLRGSSPVRGIGMTPSFTANKLRKSDSQTQLNKENNVKSKNVPVHIYTKPVRSKTVLEMKMSQPRQTVQAPPKPVHYGMETSHDDNEIQQIMTGHENIYHQICSRRAALKLVRDHANSNDTCSVVNFVVKMNDPSVLVDFLGTVLERPSHWNLDMCVLVLPKIYELLRSDKKFHCVRACDTLRLILSSFLPIIQANVDPWSPARSHGVDITREERQKKCVECRKWLLMIRNLPQNKHVGQTLTQLQGTIIDI